MIDVLKHGEGKNYFQRHQHCSAGHRVSIKLKAEKSTKKKKKPILSDCY
jgi:hypothetical protein